MKRAPLTAVLCAAAVISSLFFFLICKFDNKYTHSAPQAMGGVLMLDEPALKKHPVSFLRDGWILYP